MTQRISGSGALSPRPIPAFGRERMGIKTGQGDPGLPACTLGRHRHAAPVPPRVRKSGAVVLALGGAHWPAPRLRLIATAHMRLAVATAVRGAFTLIQLRGLLLAQLVRVVFDLAALRCLFVPRIRMVCHGGGFLTLATRMRFDEVFNVTRSQRSLQAQASTAASAIGKKAFPQRNCFGSAPACTTPAPWPVGLRTLRSAS